jgi:hypothetical protein
MLPRQPRIQLIAQFTTSPKVWTAIALAMGVYAALVIVKH